MDPNRTRKVTSQHLAGFPFNSPVHRPQNHPPKPSLRKDQASWGTSQTNGFSPIFSMYPGYQASAAVANHEGSTISDSDDDDWNNAADVMKSPELRREGLAIHHQFTQSQEEIQRHADHHSRQRPEGIPRHIDFQSPPRPEGIPRHIDFQSPPRPEPKPIEHQSPQKPPRADNLLEMQYGDKIRPCIDLIDSLRSFGVEKDLGLPAIAVIGDQSSGKSSVLEALSGVSLPRGTGIVTRCPLELKLKKNTSNEDWSAIISYLNKKERILSPLNVEIEVRKAQNAIAGSGNGIKDVLITLEIVSPHVPDLTLIDLPGITRIALPNQPLNIGQQIKEMIKKYIARQETINLAVVPSNVDIATTEVLEMAREVDPTGERTIGVLTKPDLVDKGAEGEVVRTVQNQVYTLKKGYMIVKCRGQSEIHSNISLEDALKNEKAFFENHEHFSVLLKHGLATIPNLAERLTKELVHHIARTLPNIDSQIRIKLRNAKDELNEIGRGVPDTDEGRLQFLAYKIKDFSTAITRVVYGEHTGDREDLKLFKNMRKLFKEWEKHMNASNTRFLEELKKDDNIYDNHYRGRELLGFINYGKFEGILRQEILSYEKCASSILHEVNDLVQRCFVNEASRSFEQFQNLHSYALNKTEDTCHRQQQGAEEIIKLQFRMEKNIFCMDSLYCQALSMVQQERAASPDVQPQIHHLSMEELTRHLQAYFQETTKRLSNQIPLIIQHYLLYECADKLLSHMMLLIDNKKHSYLLEEKSDLSETRHQLKCQIQRLELAHERLTEFQDFGFQKLPNDQNPFPDALQWRL